MAKNTFFVNVYSGGYVDEDLSSVFCAGDFGSAEAALAAANEVFDAYAADGENVILLAA